MKHLLTALALAGCSDPAVMMVGMADAPVIPPDAQIDPEWPADTAIPAEFDFPPYLNLLDGTTVVVSWRTVSATTGRVRLRGTELLSSTAANVHHVTLANLTAGANYEYEVAIDGTSATREGVFVMPGRTQWRFIALGEYHAPSESSGVAGFADEIRAFRPHLAVESGDMADDGNDITHWRSYLRTSAPWISNVLLLPAHSNHVNGNVGNNNLLDFFVLPHNERWYTTRYGQVQFITIDSTDAANSDVMTDEVPWIAQQTIAAHDGVDDPTFLVAAWHHPACSSQYFSRASSRSWVQTNLVATLETNGGVDLILAAHDKYYERSTITGGIVHVITNIGNISPEIAGNNHSSCTALKTLRDTRSTALFTVDGSTMSASVVDQTGAELDVFTITK